MREKVAGMDELEPIMMKDGDTFIRVLAETHPGQYQKFVDFLDGKGGGGGKTTVDDGKIDLSDMPKANAKFKVGDQEMESYDGEGISNLVMWAVQKGADFGAAKAKAEVDKRFKPIEDKEAAASSVQERQASAAKVLTDTLTEAREDWDGFKEKEKDILEFVQKSVPKEVPLRKAIRMAYNAVVINALKADKAKVRTEVIGEARKATKATSAGGSQVKAVVKKDETSGDTTSIIKDAVARARAEGRLQ
jgi:hypothetical protein